MGKYSSPKLTRAAISDKYLRDLPAIGPGIRPWIDATAEEFGVDHKTVESVITEEREMSAAHLRGRQLTRVEEAAELHGATVNRVFQSWVEALEANDDRVVKDSRGNVQKDEDGKPIVHSQPNWAARLRAGELIMKATVGFAPVKHEIEQHTIVENLSDVELKKQLADTAARLQILAATASGTQAGARVRSRIEGTAGNPRPLVLVDGVYQDPGRAGSGESVQAVSGGKGIPPTDAEPTEA